MDEDYRKPTKAQIEQRELRSKAIKAAKEKRNQFE